MSSRANQGVAAGIKAISYFLPPDRLTNKDLHFIFPKWSAEKIAARTGIHERLIARSEICSSDLAVESVKHLFKKHGISPAEIDFLLFCVQSPDYFLPTCLLQDRLEIPTSTGALDFNLGCSTNDFCIHKTLCP